MLWIVAESLYKRHDSFIRIFLDHELWYFRSFCKQDFNCAFYDNVKSISFVSLFNDILFVIYLERIQILHYTLVQLWFMTFFQFTKKLKSLEEFSKPFGVSLGP